MKHFSAIVATLATLLGIFALVIGSVALHYANNVNSDRIVNQTIQAQDIKSNLPVDIKLTDGSSFPAFLITDNPDFGKVSGAYSNKDMIKVKIQNGEFVVDPKDIKVNGDMIQNATITTYKLSNNSVTSEEIADKSIRLSDLNFHTLGSINNIVSDGGNIDIIGSESLTVTTDAKNKRIVLTASNNAAQLTNAETLDNLDSSYFMNASNLTTGTLDFSRFSAYGDLSNEGYLAFTDNQDLVTKQQLDTNFLSNNGGRVNGTIEANKIITTAHGDLDTVITAITNKLTVIENYDLVAKVTSLTDKVSALEAQNSNGRLSTAEAKINELFDKLNNLEPSTIISGVNSGCKGSVTDNTTLTCTFTAPNGKQLESLTVMPIGTKVYATLGNNPDGANSVAIRFSTSTKCAQSVEGYSYIGYLK